MSNERWKPVVGYEGLYEVSDLGRVRSVERDIIGTDDVSKSHHGKMLAPSLRSRNYLYVKLWKCGARGTAAVHRLVASAFVPNPYGKPEVNHIDGCKTNNRAENLEWCTRSENVRHAFMSGLNETTKERIAEMSRRSAARLRFQVQGRAGRQDDGGCAMSMWYEPTPLVKIKRPKIDSYKHYCFQCARWGFLRNAGCDAS